MEQERAMDPVVRPKLKREDGIKGEAAFWERGLIRDPKPNIIPEKFN